MLHTSGFAKGSSLISEYSSLLGDAVLRHRTRVAEHSARIEAEIASRVKSEFIANMSHELRTPLNTVVGFSKLLSEHDRRALKTDEIVQYASLIHDSAAHLLAVINDILDISKIQSGKFTIDAREIALGEVLHISAASLEAMATEAGVAIEMAVANDLPMIRGDSVKLRQVFTNIISNGIKFTRSGGSVKIIAVRQPDGSAIVEIADTGIGMSQQDISIALMPFGQVDSSRARSRDGMGLGLPISKSLVELHGGQLSITSTKDVGTAVRVLLPSRHIVTGVNQAMDEKLQAIRHDNHSSAAI